MAVHFKQEQKHESILRKYSKIDYKLIQAFESNDDREGIDYINISMQSKSELGRLLAPTYPAAFFTFLGKVFSIKSFMEAINTPGYPLDLLRKPRLTKNDFARIPKRVARTHLANYWALVAYAFCQRVKTDKKLKALLGKNNLEFVTYRVNRGKEFFGKIVTVNEIDSTLARYIAIVRCVQDMIKENRFTDEGINKFIEECKDQPDKDLLEGLAIKITVTDKEKTSKKEESYVNVESSIMEVIDSPDEKPSISKVEPVDTLNIPTESIEAK